MSNSTYKKTNKKYNQHFDEAAPYSTRHQCFTIATLHCWCLTSIVLGIRTPLHVPIATVQNKWQSNCFCNAQHVTRFDRCGLTSKYRPTQRLSLELPGEDQGSDLPPPPTEMRERANPYIMYRHEEQSSVMTLTLSGRFWVIQCSVVDTST